MLHMVFAIVHFQNAASDRMKNRGQVSQSSRDVMESSRRHYHYAISLLYNLLSGSSLEDLQAIGLILQHLRAFPVSRRRSLCPPPPPHISVLTHPERNRADLGCCLG